MNYSVLMSVYDKDEPSFFEEAILSIFNQTIACNDFVLVCDGEINNGLKSIVDKYVKKFKGRMNVISYKENMGLGYALSKGVQACKNEIILRADSDDISLPTRAEKEIALFVQKNADLASTNLLLFQNDINKPIGFRRVPMESKQIYSFSKRRCPFNHPSVIFKKSKVLECGNYIEIKYQEDYYLWIRMLEKRCKVFNIETPLVCMRINEKTLGRRRNVLSYKNLNKIYKMMLNDKYINIFTYVFNIFVNFMRQKLPSSISTKITKMMWK